MSEWISIEDRLPLSQDDVKKIYAVVFYDLGNYPFIATSFRMDGKWYVGECISSKERRQINVSHWMPLPELPEGE